MKLFMWNGQHGGNSARRRPAQRYRMSKIHDFDLRSNTPRSVIGHQIGHLLDCREPPDERPWRGVVGEFFAQNASRGRAQLALEGEHSVGIESRLESPIADQAVVRPSMPSL